jgi:hypothetical protein
MSGVRGFETLICLKLGYRHVLTMSTPTKTTKTSHVMENAKERTGAALI